MRKARIHVCWGGVLLASSITMSAGFVYWLIEDNAYDKVNRILIEHDKLLLEGKRDEAYQLFERVMSQQGEGPLDPVWLTLIRVSGNGYAQLGYYLRVIAAAPDREATYMELRKLIDTAPEAFHREVEPRFLSDLNQIPGINMDFLVKFDLLVDVGARKHNSQKKAPH